MTSKEKIRKELEKLNEGAVRISNIIDGKSKDGKFPYEYQNWYTKAIRLISFLAPDRAPEFKSYYEIDAKRKSIGWGTWVIQDYIKGVVPIASGFDSDERAKLSLLNQHTILQSLWSRIDGVLSNAELAIFSEIKDAELVTCHQLLRISPRAAGALAGVVLESYLQKILNSHGIKLRKKTPTVSDLNDPLKREGVYDTPTWRKISYLGDIRNLCSHKKNTEPTEEQVQELIEGVNWVTKNVF